MINNTYVIAEVGINHNGDINIAKKMILTAKDCGADIAKFQKRENKELLTAQQYETPHPNPINSYDYMPNYNLY